MAKRRFSSVKALADCWAKYKADCDARCVSTRESVTVESSADDEDEEQKKPKKPSTLTTRRTRSAPVTYTILGFCNYAGISRMSWYELYEREEKYAEQVARMHAECEQDAREKFEQGLINAKLAGLWMSNYGYGNKVETTATNDAPKNNLVDAVRDSLAALSEDDEDGGA